MKKINLIIFIFLFGAHIHIAHAEVYRINSAVSEISFKLDHVVGFSSGFVRDYSGTVDVDEKQDVIKSIVLELDMNSVDTFNEDRDRLLKSEDFFNVQSYPKIVLNSKKIAKDKIQFEIDAKGKKQSVEFEYHFLGFNNDGKTAKRKVVIVLTGDVSRNVLGVTHNVQDENGKNLLGDNLNLIFDIGAVK